MSTLNKVLSSTVGALPLSWTTALGGGLGSLAGGVVRLRRVEVEETLARAVPTQNPAERRAILTSMYRNLGRNVGECATLAFGKGHDLLDRTRFVHEERLKEAHDGGKGVLILTAHTGNWELAAAKVASLGYPFTIIAKEFRGRLANEYVDRMRERYGIRVLPTRQAYRPCLKALRNNEVIGFMLDQNMTRGEGVFVDFFGRPACTSPGLAFLSAQSGAPVVPAFARRAKGGGHEMCVQDPIAPPGDRRAETIREATQVYTRQVETFIRAHPDQWIWIHRRWRTRPLSGDQQKSVDSPAGDGTISAQDP